MFSYLHRQKPVTELQSPTKKVPPVLIETGYASIDEISTDMAARRLVPPTNKSKSEGLLNYAELVFDEQTDKPK